jgi:hypothetical protein
MRFRAIPRKRKKEMNRKHPQTSLQAELQDQAAGGGRM